MNLYRKDIGVPFINETISGVYPYKYSDELLDGWIDISTEDGIINNNLYGSYAADYVRATKEMSILFEEREGETEDEKWQTCTLNEKLCLSKRMIIDNKSLRVQVYTEIEDENNFILHADESIKCRNFRVEYAKLNIGYLLTVEDRIDLFSITAAMLNSFINANDKSIILWFHSPDGFRQRRYYSDTILNCFEQIVENGII
tara:strand:- start:97933 stop:98535 length:603 start_codon:yes stop_codon:yes gene_type:complete